MSYRFVSELPPETVLLRLKIWSQPIRKGWFLTSNTMFHRIIDVNRFMLAKTDSAYNPNKPKPQFHAQVYIEDGKTIIKGSFRPSKWILTYGLCFILLPHLFLLTKSNFNIGVLKMILPFWIIWTLFVAAFVWWGPVIMGESIQKDILKFIETHLLN